MKKGILPICLGLIMAAACGPGDQPAETLTSASLPATIRSTTEAETYLSETESKVDGSVEETTVTETEAETEPDLRIRHRLQLNPERKHQTIENFGGSGGWWAQDVGNWDDLLENTDKEIRERIIQLLFDEEEGIGLKSYRYNAGGGSADSEEPAISDPWRRAETFEREPRVYDWSKDAGAQWILYAAVEAGVEEVVLFMNSPPERMKVNGRAVDEGENGGNLAPEMYSEFAVYGVDVAEYFRSQGVPLKYISPVNEPNWHWTGGQEGMKLQPKEVVGVYEAFVDELENREGMDDVLLSGPESISIDESAQQYINAIMRSEKARGRMDHIANHIYNADPESKRWIGNWFKVAYPEYNYRMSEWTEMVSGRDTSMDSGLLLANTIYEDLNFLNATAWQYWILVSKYDWPDGLIYVDEVRKTMSETKRLWSMGNYSRYVVEGDMRIDSKLDSSSGVNVTAFQSSGEDRMTVVMINNSGEERVIMPEIGGEPYTGETVFHVTSRTHNLEPVDLSEDGIWVLPEDSVVTAIISSN